MSIERLRRFALKVFIIKLCQLLYQLFNLNFLLRNFILQGLRRLSALLQLGFELLQLRIVSFGQIHYFHVLIHQILLQICNLRFEFLNSWLVIQGVSLLRTHYTLHHLQLRVFLLKLLKLLFGPLVIVAKLDVGLLQKRLLLVWWFLPQLHLQSDYFLVWYRQLWFKIFYLLF